MKSRPTKTLAEVACIAAAYFAAAKIGLEFRTEPQKLAIFWPPNGLLLGLLLLGDRRARRVAVLTALPTCLFVNVWGGNSLAVSLGFTFVNIAEPCAAYWLISAAWKSPLRLERTYEVFALSSVALGAALVAAAPGAAVVVFGLGAPDFADVFVSFWLADAMGVMIVTPLILTWSALSWRQVRSLPAARALEGCVLFAIPVGFATAVFSRTGGNDHPLLSYSFPLFPVFVWAALRFGLKGTTAALLCVSLIAIWNTGHGRGPFAKPHLPESTHLLVVQFFLSALGIGSLALAAALAERRAMQEALRESEERYRQVTETIQEVFWVATPDRGRVLYVSPAYERVWGRSCASLYADPASFFGASHPDDPPRAAGRAASGAAADEEFRIVRPDGSVRWIHSRSFPVFGGDGGVWRIVGISRDVTDRKDAEFAKEGVIEQLQKALAEIRTLRGLIPVCAWCYKVRDDAGFWQTVDEYIHQNTEASVTHGMCPVCFSRQMESIAPGPAA